MEDEENEPTSEHQPLPWTERILIFVSPYLHLKRHIRVIYLLVVAAFFSLFKAGGEFFHFDILTGKQSMLNQVSICFTWLLLELFAHSGL